MAEIYARCKNNINPFSGKPEEGLIIGNIYKVKEIHMGQSYTSIYLEGFKSPFNSVYFNFMEEIDIYNDERFNPYL